MAKSVVVPKNLLIYFYCSYSLKMLLEQMNFCRLTDEEISEDHVFEIAGVIPLLWMEDLLKVCRSNSFDKLQAFVDNLQCEGFAAVQVFNQLHECVIHGSELDLSDGQKSKICEAIAVSESCLLDGANEYLQLLNVASVLMKTLAK